MPGGRNCSVEIYPLPVTLAGCGGLQQPKCHRLIALFWLEKISKIIESNC